MGLFTDTVTIYHKDGESWTRSVVSGVQWSDKVEKKVETGKLSIARYATITFPLETLGHFDLSLTDDAIFYGVIDDVVSDTKGHRVSDLLKAHAKSGMVQSINDNSNRTHLQHIKVIVA